MIPRRMDDALRRADARPVSFDEGRLSIPSSSPRSTLRNCRVSRPSPGRPDVLRGVELYLGYCSPTAQAPGVPSPESRVAVWVRMLVSADDAEQLRLYWGSDVSAGTVMWNEECLMPKVGGRDALLEAAAAVVSRASHAEHQIERYCFMSSEEAVHLRPSLSEGGARPSRSVRRRASRCTCPGCAPGDLRVPGAWRQGRSSAMRDERKEEQGERETWALHAGSTELGSVGSWTTCRSSD